MRQFLTAFFCLSMLAMVQNVVVATPLSGDSERAMGATSKASGSRVVASTVLLNGGAPGPATMALLVAGLSGLAAVGGRSQDQKRRVSA